MFENSFIEDCLNGEACLSDLDKYIEHWHTHNTNNSLREFLGITEIEYERWLISNDSFLQKVLKQRQNKKIIKKVLTERNDFHVISNYLFKICSINNKYMTFYYQADEEKISVCDMNSSIITTIPCKYCEIEDKLSSLKKLFDNDLSNLETAVAILNHFSVVEKAVWFQDITKKESKANRVYKVGEYCLMSKIKK